MVALLAMGAATFTSCNNDDALNGGIENPAESDAQQIVLQVSNSGDGMTTRGGRPLESSAPGQDLDEVKLIICNNKKQSNVVYATVIDNWKQTSTTYVTGGHGRETTLTLADDDKLQPGHYTVYAIGYSDNSNYSNLESDVSSIDKDDTFNEGLALTLGDGKPAEEIFAGSLEFDVEDSKGFRESVVLNRQVAGAFFYVDDIPALEGASKIRLVSTSKNEQLVLGKFANFDLLNNGENNTPNVNYVINGTRLETGEPHILCQIKLSEWFENPSLDNDKDGVIDIANNNWKEDERKYKPGSVFAGNFVVPFAKTTGKNTLTLQMVKDNGEALRSWKVKLPVRDGQTVTHSLWTWMADNDKGFIKTPNNTDSRDTYGIVRNHLYGIGQRPSNEPDDPGTGPDVPESLDTKQTLVLRVNDNWEVIHDMDIE